MATSFDIRSSCPASVSKLNWLDYGSGPSNCTNSTESVICPNLSQVQDSINSPSIELQVKSLSQPLHLEAISWNSSTKAWNLVLSHTRLHALKAALEKITVKYSCPTSSNSSFASVLVDFIVTLLIIDIPAYLLGRRTSLKVLAT